jgi:hypothetical protein
MRTLLFFAATFVSTRVFACTLCYSQVAEEVRARLFNTDFLVNLAMISLPALILFGVIFYAARTPTARTSIARTSTNRNRQ